MIPESPVFIVGVGRSGTSLLQSMLAAHSKLALPPETRFMRRYVASKSLERLNRTSGMSGVVEALAADPLFARTGLDPGRVVERAAGSSGFTDADVYRSMLECHAEAQGKPFFGDKDPKLIEHLGLLSATFPDAYVLHVVRDPRDVLASRMRAAWSRHRAWPLHLLAIRVQLQLGRSLGPELFRDRYQEVPYERLIAAPRDVLSSLCARLDLAFEPQMLDFATAARGLVADNERAWKSETMGPLLSHNFDKWRHSLGALETAVTERACAEAMRAGGYVSSGASARLRAHECLVLPVCTLAIGLGARIYAWRRAPGFGAR